jgi:hypothetical protein
VSKRAWLIFKHKATSHVSAHPRRSLSLQVIAMMLVAQETRSGSSAKTNKG